MELISVIVTTYERPKNLTEKVLKRALESIYNQTYTNIEILIVIDGISNSLINYINKIKKSSYPIKVIELDGNLGAASTRNFGIEKANGKYIAFLDDDDDWINTKLEEQIYFLKQNGDYGIVFSNVNLNAKKYKGQRIGTFLFVPNFRQRYGFVQTSTLILNSEIAKRIRFTEKLPRHQDWDYILKLYAEGIHFFHYNKKLVNYNNDLPDNLRLGRGESRAFEFSEEWVNERKSLLNESEVNGFYNKVIIPQVINSEITKQEKIKYLKDYKKNKKIFQIINVQLIKQTIKLYLL